LVVCATSAECIGSGKWRDRQVPALPLLGSAATNIAKAQHEVGAMLAAGLKSRHLFRVIGQAARMQVLASSLLGVAGRQHDRMDARPAAAAACSPRSRRRSRYGGASSRKWCWRLRWRRRFAAACMPVRRLTRRPVTALLREM